MRLERVVNVVNGAQVAMGANVLDGGMFVYDEYTE